MKMLLFLMLIISLLIGCSGADPPDTASQSDQLWTCGMHPDVLVSEPGQCPICKMDLVAVNMDQSTETAPAAMTEDHSDHTHELVEGTGIWTCPMHPEILSAEFGQCALCKMDLVAAEEDIWSCPMHPGELSAEFGQCSICKMDLVAAEEGIWSCPMHPEELSAEFGQCSICKMDLVKVEPPQNTEPPGQSAGTMPAAMAVGGDQDKKILYWRAPMDPTYVSDKPGKSPMGMDLVPVYEGEEAAMGPSVVIDPVTVQNIGVQTTPVRQENLYRAIRSVSHVDYNEETFSRVNVKYGGWIERMYVDQTGQQVRAGQPMLEIYSPELVSTQEEYLLAYRNSRKLGESPVTSIASGAQSLLDAARRRLQYWDITDEQIRALETRGTVTKTMTIYAPSDGIVVEKHAELGMRIMSGMDLYRLADLSTVWLYAHFYEHEAPWIRQGQTVEMELPYNPGKQYRGRVDYVYPYLDQQTRDIKVRLVFPNPRLELKPNMYANINLKVHMGEAVTVVPDNAVIRSGTRDMVFVALGGGKFEPRQVILGVKGEGGMMQVLSGVAPAEEVVTSAQFLLDSESRLKEAIQKMLESRRQMQTGTSEAQPTVIEPK